jgi:hypothetical protein
LDFHFKQIAFITIQPFSEKFHKQKTPCFQGVSFLDDLFGLVAA